MGQCSNWANGVKQRLAQLILPASTLHGPQSAKLKSECRHHWSQSVSRAGERMTLEAWMRQNRDLWTNELMWMRNHGGRRMIPSGVRVGAG